jgi:hypothetical protein
MTLMTNDIQGLLITGAIFKQTKPDESDEERRALERLVCRPYSSTVLSFDSWTFTRMSTLTLTLPYSSMVAEAATPKKRRREKQAAYGRPDAGPSTTPPEKSQGVP